VLTDGRAGRCACLPPEPTTSNNQTTNVAHFSKSRTGPLFSERRHTRTEAREELHHSRGRDRPILLVQQGIPPSRPADHTQYTGGSRLRAPGSNCVRTRRLDHDHSFSTVGLSDQGLRIQSLGNAWIEYLSENSHGSLRSIRDATDSQFGPGLASAQTAMTARSKICESQDSMNQRPWPGSARLVIPARSSPAAHLNPRSANTVGEYTLTSKLSPSEDGSGTVPMNTCAVTTDVSSTFTGHGSGMNPDFPVAK
jgi:hypothetical protein